MQYFRAIPQQGAGRPSNALSLAGGTCWVSHAEVLERGRAAQVVPIGEVPSETLDAITRERRDVAGLDMSVPAIMGILNVTPDSFSDGGDAYELAAAREAAREIVSSGALILDIGGESTRPGAQEVPEAEEIQRTAPAIQAVRDGGYTGAISIDTRKASVVEAALEAGANLVNDVSGFDFDPALGPLCAARDVPVCLMHAQGTPETMQDDPRYEDVLLDVYDALEARITRAEAFGITPDRIVADPGIGFGKTLAHNLALLQRISLFHSLGVPILLGASRKRFIGTIGDAPEAKDRAPGSIAVALAALAQGVQIIRVHDVAQTAQAVALWRSVQEGKI